MPGGTVSTLRSASAGSIHIHSQVCPSASFLASGAVPVWPGVAQDFELRDAGPFDVMLPTVFRYPSRGCASKPQQGANPNRAKDPI
jgi:hypothetical protein